MTADRHIELAQTWLRSAEVDLSVAELALREGLFAPACFHCQQTAEKALKAYLFTQKQELMRTHSLLRLCQQCESFDPQFTSLRDACVTLDAYYTDTRYPDSFDALEAFDKATADEAVMLARQVLTLVKDAFQPLTGRSE